MREIVFIDIDTQFDFMLPRGKLYIENSQDIIPNLKALTGAAYNNEILIVSTVDRHIKADPEFKEFPPHCVAGTSGQRKIPETLSKRQVFVPGKILNKGGFFDKIKSCPQVIFEKNAYDIFVNFNLWRVFRPFRAAFVYGVALDYCVKYAVSGLLQLGLEVNLVTDAIKSVDPKQEKPLLARFSRNGVRLVKTKELLSQIRSL
ncbi:MAG TPA: isochorismatase family protein [Candidatus Omnitrophota bacterium]|nr:isochorismatase family protein [Candidatus Omnitrophota bacterium]